MKRFISTVAVVLGLSLAFGSTSLIIEKAFAAPGGNNGGGGNSGSSNGAGGSGGAGNSGSAGGPSGQGQGGGGSNGGVGGAPGNAGGGNGGGGNGGGGNGGGGNGGGGNAGGGGSTGGGSTAGGGSSSGGSSSGASVSGASAGGNGGEGGHGTEGGSPSLSAKSSKQRDAIERDLRACNNSIIWHDTKVDGRGNVTFVYSTFPEYEVPSFVSCMKARGYNLNTTAREDMTNFGTRPDAAAKATVAETIAIIAAEAAKAKTLEAQK